MSTEPNKGDIVEMKPIDALASRVWSGTHWHYPNIERLLAEIRTLREQVAALTARVSTVEKQAIDALDERDALTAQRDAMVEAIEWACGSNGDFRPRQEGEGAYWWRTELRRRAALALIKRGD